MRFIRLQVVVIVIVVLSFGFVQQSNSQGLLGTRYIGFQFGMVNPGDDFVEEVDDAILLLGGGINLPVSPNVDANIALSYSQIDGEYEGVDVEVNAKGVMGGINYHFTPKEKTNPFIGVAVGFIDTDAEVSDGLYSLEDDETYFAFSLGTGVEIDLSREASVRPFIEYERVDDEDDFTAGINLNIWFNKSVFGGLGTSYAFDDGDISIFAGVGLGF